MSWPIEDKCNSCGGGLSKCVGGYLRGVDLIGYRTMDGVMTILWIHRECPKKRSPLIIRIETAMIEIKNALEQMGREG
jgi:hypothetical protein